MKALVGNSPSHQSCRLIVALIIIICIDSAASFIIINVYLIYFTSAAPVHPSNHEDKNKSKMTKDGFVIQQTRSSYSELRTTLTSGEPSRTKFYLFCSQNFTPCNSFKQLYKDFKKTTIKTTWQKRFCHTAN